jgi:hypothetical protein
VGSDRATRSSGQEFRFRGKSAERRRVLDKSTHLSEHMSEEPFLCLGAVEVDLDSAIKPLALQASATGESVSAKEAVERAAMRMAL